MLTQEQLKERLEYNPETGLFTWLNHKKSTYVSKQAGTKNKSTGYVQISLGGKIYKAHRLAWLYMMGSMPVGDMDHKNRIKDDNRWVNLREATKTENMGNLNLQFRNKSGQRGITYYQGAWQAQLTKGKKNNYLGRYRTKEEATVAYRIAAVAYFGAAFANVGE